MDVTPFDSMPAPGDWRLRAKCRTAPPSVFFPTRGDDVGQAKAICGACAVRVECGCYALTHPDLHGVWGGLSEQERKERRRTRRWAAL